MGAGDDDLGVTKGTAGEFEQECRRERLYFAGTNVYAENFALAVTVGHPFGVGRKVTA